MIAPRRGVSCRRGAGQGGDCEPDCGAAPVSRGRTSGRRGELDAADADATQQLPRFVRGSANQPMLDPEITCQADNIRPELIRDLQSVVATFLPAPGTSLPWDQNGVGIRRRRSGCDFSEQVLEAPIVVVKRLKCFDTDGANQNRPATRRPHAAEHPAQDLHCKSKAITLVTAERSERAMRRQ